MTDFSHITLDTSQSNPKFLTPEHLAVFDQLCEFLTQLCEIEDKVFAKGQAIEAYKKEQGITAYLPEEKALFDEVYEPRKVLFQGFATDKLLRRRLSSTYGHPAKHDYVRSAGRPRNVRADFIMKSAARLTIEFYYTDALNHKQRFVFKKIDEQWLLDETKYGFQGEDKWFVDTLC